jgi:hypothetical protein
MKRDLTRDLEVLDRLSAPDLLEEAERRALGPDRGPVLSPSPYRRRTVTASLTVLVVGFAIAGFVWLGSAFRATPAPSAGSTEPSYVFMNVRPHPGESDGDGNIQVRFEVTWSTETFPGLHRCRFQVLDLEGNVVSELGRNVAFGRTDDVWIDVPPPSDDVGSARVVCDPVRLDTPGIADVTPLDPADVGRDPDRFVEALDARVDDWAARFRIGSMSAEQLAWNMEALSSSVVTGRLNFTGDAQAWAWQEWQMRIARLCMLLPEGHDLRNNGCPGAGPPSQ